MIDISSNIPTSLGFGALQQYMWPRPLFLSFVGVALGGHVLISGDDDRRNVEGLGVWGGGVHMGSAFGFISFCRGTEDVGPLLFISL